MRADKKKARAAAKLLALLKDDTIIKTEKSLPKLDDLNPEDLAREAASRKKILPEDQAEAVLSYLAKPERFALRRCKRTECGELFAANYKAVAYCSNNCRARDFKNIYGIDWDWTKPEPERWGNAVLPLVISPGVLKKLRGILQTLNDLLGEEEPTQDNVPEAESSYSRWLDELVPAEQFVESIRGADPEAPLNQDCVDSVDEIPHPVLTFELPPVEFL